MDEVLTVLQKVSQLNSLDLSQQNSSSGVRLDTNTMKPINCDSQISKIRMTYRDILESDEKLKESHLMDSQILFKSEEQPDEVSKPKSSKYSKRVSKFTKMSKNPQAYISICVSEIHSNLSPSIIKNALSANNKAKIPLKLFNNQTQDTH